MAVNEVKYTSNAQNTPAVQAPLRLADQLQKVQQVKEQTLSALLEKDIPQRELNIVANAVNSFAKSTIGKLFEQNTKVKNKDKVHEQDFLKEQDESLLDQVTLQPRGTVAKLQRQLSVKEDRQHADKLLQTVRDEDSRTAVEQFSQMYGKSITTRSGVASEELEKLERKLKTKGFDTDQLLQLKLSIKQSLRGAAMQQIKDAYLKRTLSMDMVVEYGSADIGLQGLLDEIIGNEKLGGEDFGNVKGGLQGAVNSATDEVARDVRVALKEMLDQKMTERLVSNTVDPKTARKELEFLLKVGGRVGFDPGEYMQSWYKEKINQGLFVFEKPEDVSLIANARGQAGQQNQQNQQNQASVESSDDPKEYTEDYLINRLRALYIRSAIKDDWRTSLDTSFKIIRTKNKMIKLGVFSEDVNERVKQESLLIAGSKIMEMLNEAYLERATLYRLKGPAYNLVEAKLTGLLKNTEKLGMDVTPYELTLMRDKANLMVFDVSKRELKLTMVSLAIQKTPALQDKKKKLIMLLDRLKEESDLTDEIGLSDNELGDRVELQT